MKQYFKRLVSLLAATMMLFNVLLPAGVLASEMEISVDGVVLGPYKTGIYSPRDILGEAVNFGIVCGTLVQASHTETNFAVKHYKRSNSHVIDMGQASTDAIPYYIAHIDDPLRFGSNHRVPTDLFIRENDEYQISCDNQANYRINKIYCDASTIEGKVNSLAGGTLATSLISQPATFTPDQNTRKIDTTDYPNNAVIFIDCTHFQINNGGWEIEKLEGQQIVFNIPTNGHANVGQFKMTVWDENK